MRLGPILPKSDTKLKERLDSSVAKIKVHRTPSHSQAALTHSTSHRRIISTLNLFRSRVPHDGKCRRRNLGGHHSPRRSNNPLSVRHRRLVLSSSSLPPLRRRCSPRPSQRFRTSAFSTSAPEPGTFLRCPTEVLPHRPKFFPEHRSVEQSKWFP